MKAHRAHQLLLIALVFYAPLIAPAEEPKGPPLHGELREVDGVRVLRVWGTPRERGFAHGYLLAADIVRLLNEYLREDEVSGGVSAYAVNLRRLPVIMKLLPRYEEELKGMAEGIREKLGDRARLAALQREIGYDDLFAINCIPDTARMGCSSFAVWGPMTKTGATIAGRNLDWHRMKALGGTEVVIAFVPERESPERGWVSVSWPGFVGCLTGMNSEGVTLSMHDVPTGRPTAAAGFTPRGFALREAIESADGRNPPVTIQHVLQSRRCAVGNNVPVSWPHPGKGFVPGAAVLEYDGNLQEGGGVTLRTVALRSPKKDAPGLAGDCFQVCTNHFCMRAKSRDCDRFEKLQRLLRDRDTRAGFATDDAWQLLREVACGAGPLETYHSVVFEADLRRLHVAFSTDGKAAAFGKPATLEVAELLAPGSR